MLDSESSHILDYVLGTLQSSAQALQIMEAEKAALIKAAAAAEVGHIAKLAEAHANIFPREDVDRLVEKLTSLGILPANANTKVAKHLCDKPESALSFIDQIVDVMTSPTPEGAGVAKAGSSVDNEDPDGWDDFCAGRTVRLHR